MTGRNPPNDRISAELTTKGSQRFFDVPGRELEDLLYPVTPQRFIDHYWAREVLHIKGPPVKYAKLFSREAFHAAARGAGAIRVEFNDRRRLPKADPEDIDSYIDVLFEQGATICLTDIGHTNARLQAVVDAIKKQLQFTGVLDVRSYLSSDGCGYATHADARIATTLQISGKKRWRFSRHSAVDFPLRNIVAGPAGYRVYHFETNGPPRLWEKFEEPDEASFSEVVLEPGDLLCLPAGTWHSAQAIGHSLAINLAFNPISCDQFILSALRERLLAIPEWRRSIPLVLGDQSDGVIPNHVASFFAARLGELAYCAEMLRPDGPELAHAWRERIYSRTPSATEEAKAVPSDAIAIQPNTRFVRNSFTGYGWSLDEVFKATLTIYAGTRSHSIQTSDRMEPFVRTLMTMDSFCAGDSLLWAHKHSPYEWPEVVTMLRELLDAGVISRKTASGGATLDPMR